VGSLGIDDALAGVHLLEEYYPTVESLYQALNGVL
jgi:hypothetical protein